MSFGPGYITKIPPLLLDQHDGAAAAYSLRLLRVGYNGPCIRVRRSSDNAEKDIGFSGGTLDTNALTSFVGSNDGYVVRWYDQSGKGRDATQGTQADQARIVSSGSVLSVNGNPFMDNGGFEAFDNVFAGANATNIVAQSVVIESNNFKIGNRLVGVNADSVADTGQFISSRDDRGKVGIGQEKVSGTNGVSVDDGNVHTLALLVNGSVEPVFYVDDMTTQQSTVSQSPNGSGSLTIIMAKPNDSSYWKNKGLEFIIYNNVDQKRREAIAADQKDYYGS
jgi:hypothetical protein